MIYRFPYIRTSISALTLTLSSAVGASITDEPSYFLFGGNPVASKYVAGKMVRLPVQDAYDPDSLRSLEAVSGLLRASLLRSLSAQPLVVNISLPHVPEYGEAMFEVIIKGSVAQKIRPPILVWSGSTPFREIVLGASDTDARLKQTLIAQSRHMLIPMLDFRSSERVGRRLKITGPVSVRDYGRTSLAPHLAFVDITWRIDDLPESLANNGIDSWSPYLRVEYVVNTRTGRMVYRNTSNDGGIERHDMRLFKEPGGPLLMAVSIACSDGSEPLILDLENESYGTGRTSDVPKIPHCFPAQ